MKVKVGRFIARAKGYGKPLRMRSRDARDESGVGGGAEPPRPALRERRFDRGNRRYVASLPLGSYEAEDDEEAGLTRVHGGGNATDDESEFVIALPLGSYEVERDEAGAHLYRLPDDANPREPLKEAGQTDDLPARLRAQNLKHREHYRRGKDDDDGDVGARGPRITADEIRKWDRLVQRGIVAAWLVRSRG
jgi:hypothetical protein